MKLNKIEPQFIKNSNPRIGLIALATDFMIEKDFIKVIKDKEIDFFVSFKTQILLLSKVSNWILNAVLSFWIQRFLLELLKDLPVEQKYKASSKEVFPEPFAPYIKLLNLENSRSKPLKQRKFEIDIFFIDTF